MLNPTFIYEEIMRNLSPIEKWLKDKAVTELMVNPGGELYVEKAGVVTYEGQVLRESQINSAIIAVAKHMKQDARPNSPSAIVTASIGDLRFAGALPPVAVGGSFMSIRKHRDKDERPTLEQLINDWKALTQDEADLLVDMIVNQKKNCIIAGATGSGKTTVTNALLSKIPQHERVITIEDASELHIDVQNKVQLIVNPDLNITARTLVKLAMRTYPGRLILGETRGDETYDVIRAFQSGHDGSVTTVHASSAEGALEAIEMLYQMSLPPGSTIPTNVARRYIAKAVHVLVFVGKRIVHEGGVFKAVRRIEEILLLKGVENGEYVFEKA